MNGRSDYPKVARRADLERQANTRSDYVNSLAEIDALRAELSALKARRCDGCAHATQVDIRSGWNPDEYRQCNLQAQSEAPMFSDCSGRTAKWQEIIVDVSHSCAAWTPKEPQP